MIKLQRSGRADHAVCCLAVCDQAVCDHAAAISSRLRLAGFQAESSASTLARIHGIPSTILISNAP